MPGHTGRCEDTAVTKITPALESNHPEWAGLGWGMLIMRVINNVVTKLY